MKLHQTLSKIKKELGPIHKDCKNSFGGFKYVSLSSILERVNELNEKYGVNFSITNAILDKEMSIQFNKPYYSIHYSVSSAEESIDGCFSFPQDETASSKMKPIQATGSMLTYAQRYILSGVYGLQLEDDADSEKRTPEKTAEKTEKVKEEPRKWMRPEQENHCEMFIENIKAINDLTELKKHVRISSQAAPMLDEDIKDKMNQAYIAQVETIKNRKAAA